mgnify:FL=1
MVKFVENELQTIKQEVNDMWELVQKQFENARTAVLSGDRNLAAVVIGREKRVNSFELRIDSDIEDFIALYNPVAIDLRFSLAMLNIANNLERLGDYAEGIARFVVRNEVDEQAKELIDQMELPKMYDMVLDMLSTVFKALKNHDIETAKSVFGRDDAIDDLNRESLDRLTDYATAHPQSVRLCLEVSALFRKLERAGDHINNLAEQTVYYIDAEVLKHTNNKEL